MLLTVLEQLDEATVEPLIAMVRSLESTKT
jgi:hypothetical protein